jgi:LacI family transcriptional regulator
MPTIRDVANHCGVSTATVSHVLNGRVDRVGSDTRDRVLAAVRALQYRLPAVELSSTQTRRRNIAIVCGEMSPQPVSKDHYFSRVLDGVLEATASRGYSLTIVFERMWVADGSSVRQSYDGHCDGAI